MFSSKCAVSHSTQSKYIKTQYPDKLLSMIVKILIFALVMQIMIDKELM